MSWHPTMIKNVLLITLVTNLVALAGCQRGQVSETLDGPTTEELIAFYSPQSIKILPFTKPRSFDDDAIPDGIGVSLRPLDGAGDPVKAYGAFIFELYTLRSAAGNRRGTLLQTWHQEINDLESQKQFWERVTSTYEFHLSWEGMPISPQKKYILTASFQSPGSERLFDEYEFEFQMLRDQILKTKRGP